MRRRFTVWQRIVWHGGRSLKAMILCDFLALLLLLRDEFLPQRWQEWLRLSALPSLSLWQWTTVAAVLFAAFVLEGAFRVINPQMNGLELAGRPAPEQRAKLGSLDYIPEFKRAAEGYSAALRQIKRSMSNGTMKMAEKNAQMRIERNSAKKQALGVEIAKAIASVNEALTSNPPILNENVLIMREAALGFLRTTAIASNNDRAALAAFKKQVIGLRGKTKELRAIIAALMDTTARVHKRNISIAINGAIEQMRQPLREYERIVIQVDKDWGRVERAIGRKLFLVAIRRLVHRKAAPQRPPAS